MFSSYLFIAASTVFEQIRYLSIEIESKKIVQLFFLS